LRLGRFFQMSAQFWLNLQSHYDLEIMEGRLGRRLEREVKVLVSA
jgi:plasmid maintenance system antidote protein VapI